MGRRLKRYRLSHTFILVVALMIFGLGIGYAAISTTLTIDGTSDIDSASWDVHFNNVQVTSGSVSATTPAISNNTSVSFSANLANPGDFYEFKIDVVNAGTLDAKLDGIEILPVLTQAQQNYFKYTVTYLDGIDIGVNDALESGDTETLLIRFEYLTQSDTSLYPTDDTNFNFSVSMTYVQGHGNVRERFIYHTNTSSFTLGQSVPAGTTYNNSQAAITAFEHPYLLKQRVSNNVITESYVGFKHNDKFYYTRGGIDETSLTTKPVYEANKVVLLNIFSNSECNEYSSPVLYFYCIVNVNNYYFAEVSSDGKVYFSDGIYGCIVRSDGTSHCGDDFY